MGGIKGAHSRGGQTMNRWAVFLVFLCLSWLVTFSCKKKEENVPGEPPPGAVPNSPGEKNPQTREGAIEKQEYQDRMKERANNNPGK